VDRERREKEIQSKDNTIGRGKRGGGRKNLRERVKMDRERREKDIQRRDKEG
jgi:hypothetical protein